MSQTMTADFRVLFTGYIEQRGTRVASTVSLVRDGDARIIIDPGMVPEPEDILRPLRESVASPNDVTDVILSHHHPDHTLNAALFPRARVHDFWAIYRGDHWESRGADGVIVSPSVRLIATPGHTPQDVTTLVSTSEGVVAFTHLWWSAEGPAEDRLASDRDALHRNRVRVLGLATQIVPGHGPRFHVTEKTPR